VPFAEIKFTLTPFSLFTDVDLEDDATRFVPAARSIVLVCVKKYLNVSTLPVFFLKFFLFRRESLANRLFFFISKVALWCVMMVNSLL